MALDADLKSDVSDELQAVRNYAGRAKQLAKARRHTDAKKVRHIRREEQGHARALSGMRRRSR